MAKDIAEAVARLLDKDNKAAYAALRELQAESESGDGAYIYIDSFIDMLEHKNAYIRIRGLVLTAYNARWDTEYKIDEIIDRYLRHITDPKPIAARQCIRALPLLAASKPELKPDIIRALERADISIYTESMQPLMGTDLQKALGEIKNNL